MSQRPTLQALIALGVKLRRASALSAMMFGTMSMGLTTSVMVPMLPNMATEFGGGSSGTLMAQFVFTVAFVGLIVGGPFTGGLIARVGPRAMLMSSLLLFTACGTIGLWLTGPIAFLVARFWLGFASAGINTASVFMISQQFGQSQRGRALLGYYNAIGPLAALVVFSLAGAVAEFGGWRAPFLFYLISLFVFALALNIPLTQQQPTPALERKQTKASSSGLWPYYLLLALMSVPMYSSSIQAPFLLEEHGLARPTLIAAIAATSSIGVIVGAFSYGLILMRLGNKYTFFLILTLLGCGHLLMGSTGEILMIGCGSLITQFGGGMVVPYFLNLLFDRTEHSAHGKIAGLVYGTHFIGAILNPLLMAPFNTTLGVQHTVLLLGICLASGAAAALRCSPTGISAEATDTR